MKRTFGILLAVVLVITIVNDASRWAKARYDVGVIATEAAQVAAANRRGTRDANGIIAAEYARTQGAEVYLYDQDEERAYVWAQMPLKGTWVLGRYLSWNAGKPIEELPLVAAKDSARLY